MIIGRCIYTTFLYPIRLKSIFQQQSMAEKNRIRKTRAEKKGTPATPPNTGAKRRGEALVNEKPKAVNALHGTETGFVNGE